MLQIISNLITIKNVQTNESISLFQRFSNHFFIGACSTIEEPKLISVDNIELVNDNDEEFILNTNLSIYNPNWFSFLPKTLFLISILTQLIWVLL